jgi:hypothetical protein
MATVTVTGFSLGAGEWHWSGATAKLRLYSNVDFIDSLGVQHLHGTIGSKNGCYLEIDCTVASNTLSVPTFIMPSTVDALDPSSASNILITGILFDSKDARRETLFSNFQIQTTTPITFDALKIRNRSRTLPSAPTRYLDAPGVQVLIDSALGSRNHAALNVEGTAFLDTNPLISSHPEAVGSNSPLLFPVKNVISYEADPTGVTDSTTAIQAAIAAAGAGGTVIFPKGTYRVTGLLVDGLSGIKLMGVGGNQSGAVLSYAGAINGAVIEIQDAEGVTIESLQINGGGVSGAIGVYLRWNGGTPKEPKNITLKDLEIYNIPTGVKLFGGAVAENTFWKLHIHDCTTQGVLIDNSNALDNNFYDCRITSSVIGINVNAGAIRMYGGIFTQNSTTDIYVANGFVPIILSGVYTEQSAAFITTGGPSTTALGLLVEGCSIFSPATSGVAINYRLGGQLSLIGNQIGIGNLALTVRIEGSAGSGGSSSSAFSAGNIFVTSTPYTLAGNNISLTAIRDTIKDPATGIMKVYSDLTFANDAILTMRLLRTNDDSADQISQIVWSRGRGTNLTTKLWTLRNDFPTTNTFALYNGVLDKIAWGVDATNHFDVQRYKATQGTSLVLGDFALSAGFGTTASVAVTSNSKDTRGEITITSAGTGQGANPTVTLTFKDGTFGTAGFAVVSRSGGSQLTVPVSVSSISATQLVIKFLGTPVDTETYKISWIVMG